MSRKLLLADDSITIQKVIGIIFAHEDYQMTIVDNGEAALTKAHAEQPDLILADVFMPGKNGYEVCAAVKQDPRLKRIPVLLLTGTFEPFDEAKAKAAGADSWIPKPFESQALIDRVEELLARAAAPTVPAPELEPALAAATDAMTTKAEQWGESTRDQAGVDTSFEGELWSGSAGAVEGLWNEPAAAADDVWSEPAGGDVWNPPLAAVPDAAAAAGGDDAWKEPAGGDDDLWGAIGAAAGGEQEPSEPAVDDWSGLTAEVDVAVTSAAAPVEVTGHAATDEFSFDETPAEGAMFPSPAPSTAVAGTWAESAESPAEWAGFEEDILPLDENDIIEEEELEEIPPPAAYAEAAGVDDFSFEEEMPAALASEYAFDDSVVNAAATEEPVFDDIGVSGEAPAAEEFMFGEEGFDLVEGTPAAVEPQWDVAGSDELTVRPALSERTAPLPAFAREPEPAVAPRPPVEPPAAGAIPAAAVEEQVAALSEAEVTRIVERVAAPVIERLAEAMLAKIAWEVVPDLAESMIRDEIRKIRESVPR